jgi:hypothetical protein
MHDFEHLNLINLFDFYLASMFVLGVYRRFGQYRAIGGLALAMPGRWPRLLELVKQHSMIFLTWATFLPGLLALVLTIVQVLASRVVWHQATLTPHDLADRFFALGVLSLLGSAMLAVDLYWLVVAGKVDQEQMSRYFDEAEHWLGTWKAPVVRIITLGKIDPRQMVTTEVRKALLQASQLINSSLWWVSTQIGLRVLFGLALWLAWALG